MVRKMFKIVRPRSGYYMFISVAVDLFYFMVEDHNGNI